MGRENARAYFIEHADVAAAFEAAIRKNSGLVAGYMMVAWGRKRAA